MSFTFPMHPIPFKDSFQSPMEPVDITDSSPLSLYILCLKYIVQNISNIFINCKLPAEVCDNLIEAFRLYGSKKFCSSFMSAISTRLCTVRSANLSNLDITNEELFEFVETHGKTLLSLDISNCNRLSPLNVLQHLNRELTKVHNMDNLTRLVNIYEVPKELKYKYPRYLKEIGYRPVIRKLYHKGKITTEVFKKYYTACRQSFLHNSSLLKMECPNLSPTINDNIFMNMNSSSIKFETICPVIPKTAYEMNRFMGLFCDPYIAREILSDMEPDIFACYDRACDDHTIYHPFVNIKSSQIIKSKENSRFLEEDFDPNEFCSYCHGSRMNQQKIQILPKIIYNNLPYFIKYFLNREEISYIFDSNEIDIPKKYLMDKSEMILPPDDDDDVGCQKYMFNSSNFFYTSETDAPKQLNKKEACDSQRNPEAFFFKFYLDLQKTEKTNDTNSLGRRSNVNYQSRIKSINKMNDMTTSVPTATSSSCPILSSCSEAPFYNYESNKLIHLKYNITNNNRYIESKMSFPKKFRPHSHNAIETHIPQSSSYSRAQNFQDSNLITINNNNNKDNNTSNNNNNIESPTNSHISSLSFALSNSSNSNESNLEPEEMNTFDYHEITCPLHPNNIPTDCLEYLPYIYKNMDNTTPELYIPEEKLRFDFFPFKYYIIDEPTYPFTRIVEISTWSTSSLQSLSFTKNTISNAQNESSLHPYLFNSYNAIKRLTINDWPIDVQKKLFQDSLYLDRIRYLDLSYCKSIGDGSSLMEMTNLETLILYNVMELDLAIKSICNIKSLKILDISNSEDEMITSEPISYIHNIVSSLKNLTSLDISGTNLAAGIITALATRENKPLEFLGIFHANIESSSWPFINANKIAGDNSEEMILNSCEAYINRPEMMRKCLNELFQTVRYDNGRHDMQRAVKILVTAIGRYPNDKQIQVAGSAGLFYLIKSEEAKQILGRNIKELIVTRLLDAMQTFRFDQTMLRNGCLNLIHFRIPGDVIFEYTRLADILLFIVTKDDEDEFVQKLGIYLLNSLACQVDGEQKTIVGNLGAIEKMLHLIQLRYNRNICDEVMETAWSTMWNVTDETPINCERFLNHNGLEFFITCMEKFPQHPELLRNMMGLLGNVSECAHLRYRLMHLSYINRFVMLLDSESDGIEVSYNSAGILAHIASDGVEIWNRHLPGCTRDLMLNKMENAITRWKINSKRNINYRSFEPILRLLRVLSISWQAQYWAVWALANLTRVHTTKYCTLLEKDGGVEVLKSFISSPRPDNYALPISVKRLAVITLFQYYLYSRLINLKTLERCNDIVCFNLIKSKQIVIEFFHTYDLTHLATEFGIDYDLNQNYFDEDIIMADISSDNYLN